MEQVGQVSVGRATAAARAARGVGGALGARGARGAAARVARAAVPPSAGSPGGMEVAVAGQALLSGVVLGVGGTRAGGGHRGVGVAVGGTAGRGHAQGRQQRLAARGAVGGHASQHVARPVGGGNVVADAGAVDGLGGQVLLGHHGAVVVGGLQQHIASGGGPGIGGLVGAHVGGLLPRP